MQAEVSPITASEAHKIVEAIHLEIAKQIVGQGRLIERLLVALLANGHLLIEGVPGLAKTKTLTALSASLNLKMQRVQFTPDLLPSDLVGTEVYRPQTAEFAVRQGPVFTNILLADEINRAPAKVQSALLQAMQERCVTIGESTFKLPDPFLVLATQNPIEQEGTYPLPEAQLDRFLLKVVVSYPSFDEELQIVKRVANEVTESQPINRVLNPEQLLGLRRGVAELYVDDRLDRYIVSIIHASREPERYGLKGMVEWGASPRASIAMKVAARALAYLRGKAFVTPEEVKEIAPDVLRHRILPSFEAEARSITSGQIIETLLRSVTIP